MQAWETSKQEGLWHDMVTPYIFRRQIQGRPRPVFRVALPRFGSVSFWLGDVLRNARWSLLSPFASSLPTSLTAVAFLPSSFPFFLTKAKIVCEVNVYDKNLYLSLKWNGVQKKRLQFWKERGSYC